MFIHILLHPTNLHVLLIVFKLQSEALENGQKGDEKERLE
jgi:hypothetical protein